MKELKDIKTWMLHEANSSVEKHLVNRSKPGYKALFDGPGGSDKIKTVQMLAKEFGKEVHRVALSQVVSKFIGETEKNLSAIFKEATAKGWILFFDEAEALFGKRTEVKDSHDRFANQEVNYLLQQMENYPGLTILAANLKGAIDKAFVRRFHTILHFPAP